MAAHYVQLIDGNDAEISRIRYIHYITHYVRQGETGYNALQYALQSALTCDGTSEVMEMLLQENKIAYYGQPWIAYSDLDCLSGPADVKAIKKMISGHIMLYLTTNEGGYDALQLGVVINIPEVKNCLKLLSSKAAADDVISQAAAEKWAKVIQIIQELWPDDVRKNMVGRKETTDRYEPSGRIDIQFSEDLLFNKVFCNII